MEFEDSRKSIFCDPNAYVQHCETQQIKKVVFSEPYDCLPTFYIDNSFKKHSCECIPNRQPPKRPCSNHGSMFDLKSIMPILLGVLNKGGGGSQDLTKLMTGFMQPDSAGIDLKSLIATLAKNPKIIESVLSVFKGKGLKSFFKKTNSKTSDFKQETTEHVINDYTRVD